MTRREYSFILRIETRITVFYIYILKYIHLKVKRKGDFVVVKFFQKEREVRFRKVGVTWRGCGYSLTQIGGDDVWAFLLEHWHGAKTKAYIRSTPYDGEWLVFQADGEDIGEKFQVTLAPAERKTLNCEKHLSFMSLGQKQGVLKRQRLCKWQMVFRWRSLELKKFGLCSIFLTKSARILPPL